MHDEKISNLIKNFGDTATTEYPDISQYSNAGEQGLWILWVAKDKMQSPLLNSGQIADILVESIGINVSAKSITNSFRSFKVEIHKKIIRGIPHYSIMQAGVNLLKSRERFDVRLFSFLPGTEFTSRNVLKNDILNEFDGDIKVVDPFCGEETLDLLGSYENGNIKFLTSISSLKNKNKKEKIQRSIVRFKKQYTHVDVRDYQEYDIHDRYIISESKMVLLGQGIKNIGNKESYAIMFDKGFSSDIMQSVATTFDSRWKRAIIIK